MSHRLILLWSTPRSRSSAFFRSMLERGDLVALHEPFCDLVDHGATDVLGQTIRNVDELKAVLVGLAREVTVFVKETTDHPHRAVFTDDEFTSRVTHTFLVRRPDEIAASYFALKPHMRCDEVGVEHLWRMYVAVAQRSPEPPPVVDSHDLVTDPAATMAAYCRSVGLPFAAESLNWTAEHRPEWRQSKRWHAAVARTSHFADIPSVYDSTVANTPLLAEFSARHQPYFERLRAVALQPR